MAFVNSLGRFFFEWRDKLPVPLAVAMISCARPRPANWVIGMPLVLAGEALRVWGLMHIGPTTRTREICADRLVTSGPYSCCRNPLYLANLLKITGFMMIAGNLKYAATVLAFYCVEFSTMIPYEEGFLATKFPEEHRLYRDSVPAFFPKPPAGKGFDAAPAYDLNEALKSERRTFASTSAILLLLAFCSIFRRENRA
ncbi:MAG: isoprenylcysteine carboxylmethyltransferase family protein [Candidatus Riflebacteria bacterium]|nr:isoprenylcysteine carboxylmethyltransferase family protein [Candidatus Riflebacteria bacterium]